MLKYTDYDIVFSEIPDETTFAINISNCPNRCPGCHSPQLMEDIGELLTEHNLGRLVDKYINDITCICFMGGDREPQEINKLAAFIKNEYQNIKTGWYSGKPQLPSGFNTDVLDYIKLGPYVAALGGLKSKTTNQRLYQYEKGGNVKDITFRFWEKNSI